jgi:hypothetical protein
VKLPLLQKIDIKVYDEAEVKNILTKNALGKIPTILIMSDLTIEQAKVAIKAFEKCFRELKMDPHFPYPTYFLNEWSFEQDYFPNLKSMVEAPKHFLKKIKRVKKREQVLLDKVTTLSERINNHSISDDLDYITLKAKDNKVLKELCAEKSFYLELLQNLKNPSRGLEDKEV